MGTGQRRSRELSGHLEKKSLRMPECSASQEPTGQEMQREEATGNTLEAVGLE